MYSDSMTLVIPVGYANVIESMTWLNDPEPMAVTYGVAIDAAATVSDLPAIAAGLGAAFDANIMPVISSILTHTQTEVTWQQAAGPSNRLIGVDASTTTGGDSEATVIPQNSAYLIHKRTATGGRGGRGRFYLPGVGETDVDNFGNIAGAKITALNAAVTAWRTAVLAVALVDDLVLLHNDPGAFAADAPRSITSLVADPVLSTQRRRLRR